MKTLKNYNVIFIEDDETIVLTISKLLELMFGKVQYATNGLKALDIVKNENFDLIITDIKMPEMNGIEFLENLKKLDKNIPTIVVSAHTEKEIINEIGKLGILDYLIKPLDVQELISVAKRVLV